MAKIDSVYDFTDKGLVEVKSWLEPWFLTRCPCAAATTVTPCSESVLTLASTNTLTAYWRLNEGAPPYADTSGYNPADPADMTIGSFGGGSHPMTQAFTPAATTEDATAVAFTADGSSGDFEYLHAAGMTGVDRFAFPGTAPFTVVAWVAPAAGVASSLGSVVDYFNLSSWSPPTGFTHGWALGVNQPAQTPYFQRLANVSYGVTPPTVTGPAISTGHWHLLAGVYDGTQMRLYVDNVLVGTLADTSSLPLHANTPQIGVGQNTTATNQLFLGAVAEVSVWGDPLTTIELTTLFNCASAASTFPGASQPWVRVQTGPPSSYLTPFVFDDTAVTGGLYGWDGSAYQQVGPPL